MRHFLFSMLAIGMSFLSFGNTIPFKNLSYEQAIAQAKAEEKFLFVDFYTDWCRPCKVMEQQVFSNDSVAALFSDHFISIRVNAEEEQPAYVSRLGVAVYPTLAFYDPKGRLVFRQEGVLETPDFYHLSHSLVHLNDYLSAYQKNDRKAEVVHDYLMALSWISPAKARKLALKYLYELKEKSYTLNDNWELIDRFLPATHRVLFPRIIESELVKTAKPNEREELLLRAYDDLLNQAISSGNSAFLRRRAQYIKKYGDFHHDPDSLSLVGNLQYASIHDPLKYPGYITTYIDDYLTEDAATFADISYEMSQRYFQRSVLDFAADLAHRSIHLQPNFFAYLSLSSISDKLLQYKAAYGYLLLAYQFADEEQQKALDEKEQALKHKMEFELQSGVNLVNELKDDGRFTLGAGNERLMYGYPIPQSTSHFVVNIDGKLGSNAQLGKDVTYLTGVTELLGSGITPMVVTTFQFEDVLIKQTLLPVDKEGAPIEYGLAQSYQISYELSTKHARSKKVGLSMLFDTMMDDNDACAIAAKGIIIPYEYEFKRKQIPKELLFYHTPNDTSKLMGYARLSGWKSTPPDILVVGRWPYLHSVKWGYQTRKVRYGDSAYMLRWENRFLSSREPVTFTTYYGLPLWKKPLLRVIMKDNKSVLTSTTDVFFENNQSSLDLNAKMKIQEILDNESIDIVGVILQGYADVTGGRTYNFDLSKQRIQSVGKIFSALNIPYVPKPYGYDQSNQNVFNQVFGNAFDRKVSIVVYYRLRSQRVVSQAYSVD